jgi:hypothetical protein
MIAIAGPLSLVQAGLFSSIHQRNQITAIYLAQEALEYIKALRDTNSYVQNSGGTRNWLAGPNPDNIPLNTTCTSSVGCYVDPHGKLPVDNGNVFVQSASISRNLYQNDTPSSGAFSYSYDTSSGRVASPYKRTVKIVLVNADEATVSVTIEWNDNALSRSYTVSENIYNYAQP